MRTLKFIVEGQILKPDPTCDFTGLVPGTSEMYIAEFSFSPEWDDCLKVVGFYSRLGKEYPPQILKSNKTCIIPSEALKKRIFKIQVIGKNGSQRLTTNKVEVNQNGGRV